MLLVHSKPHLLVDLYGCDPARLNDLAGIRRLLLETAGALRCTTIGDIFHQFSPHGVTGVVAIAESHVSVHTWVEDGYAAVDLFLCNSAVAEAELSAAIEGIAGFLGAERSAVHTVQRGAAPYRAPALTGARAVAAIP